MTRILFIETASSRRIRDKVEQILSGGTYPDPEVSIVCNVKNSQAFSRLPGTKVYALEEHSKYRQMKERGLTRDKFDLVFAFWTGEKQYRKWKWLGLRLKAKDKHIVAGDGNEFRLTWKSAVSHTIFRWNHPLPTDHWDYVGLEQERPAAALETGGTEVLIIQSAEPGYLLKSLERLQNKPIFIDPRYTVFCRNHPEAVASLRGHPMVSTIITHSETRGSWHHLRALRRMHFDTVLLFLTGDRSYRKVKLFAFLLGARHTLIFNEFCECFFFNWKQFLALAISRFQGRMQPAAPPAWSQPPRLLVSLILKSVLLPFRFLWLLLVWLRLRIAG